MAHVLSVNLLQTIDEETQAELLAERLVSAQPVKRSANIQTVDCLSFAAVSLQLLASPHSLGNSVFVISVLYSHMSQSSPRSRLRTDFCPSGPYFQKKNLDDMRCFPARG